MGEVTAAQVLAVPMGENDSEEATLGGYLARLLELLWEEGEEFSSKRPFGNSGWESDFDRPLHRAGLVEGTVDQWEEFDVDSQDVDRLVRLAIGVLREPAPATAETSIWVRGASDDLIEIGGVIQEEFVLQDSTMGDLIAVSDGTVLRVAFGREGIWRIAPVARGKAGLHIEQTTDEDGTDVAHLTGDISWVVHGVGIVRAK